MKINKGRNTYLLIMIDANGQTKTYESESDSQYDVEPFVWESMGEIRNLICTDELIESIVDGKRDCENGQEVIKEIPVTVRIKFGRY